MKQLCSIKSKLRLIYTSPLLYLMMFLQISFVVIHINGYKTDAVSNYAYILKNNFFMWLICIPVMVLQHKVSIYSTYYSFISRICRKRKMILVDYITLAVSTCISTFIVLSVPLIFLILKNMALVGQEMFADFLFFLMRYVLLGLLIQYIIYSLIYAFPGLQKKGGSICVLPFLLYFVFTSPMEFLSAEGQYLPFLDFSAGAGYVFVIDGVVLWGSIFFYNIHLVGYLVLVIWMTVVSASKRWEFWENESVSAL